VNKIVVCVTWSATVFLPSETKQSLRQTEEKNRKTEKEKIELEGHLVKIRSELSKTESKLKEIKERVSFSLINIVMVPVLYKYPKLYVIVNVGLWEVFCRNSSVLPKKSMHVFKNISVFATV
jgi:hypothetical protein